MLINVMLIKKTCTRMFVITTTYILLHIKLQIYFIANCLRVIAINDF